MFVAPNNPTGDDDRVGIKHAAQRCGSAGGFVLIDGAFAMPKAADPNHTSLIDVLGINLMSFIYGHLASFLVWQDCASALPLVHPS